MLVQNIAGGYSKLLSLSVQLEESFGIKPFFNISLILVSEV